MFKRGPGSVCTSYTKQVMEAIMATIMAVSFIEFHVFFKEMQAFSSATACQLVCNVFKPRSSLSWF
jgi:hypothetical protein